MKRSLLSIMAQPLELLVFLVVCGSAIVFLATPYTWYALLPAGGILALIFLIRFPAAGFYLILFLVPFGAYRAYIPKAIGVVLIVFLLIFALLHKHRRFPLHSNLWPWIGAFVAVNVVAAVFSPYPSASVDGIRQLLTVVAIFLMTLVFISPPRHFTLFLPAVLVASGATGAVLSVVGYLGNVPAFMQKEEELVRAMGGARNPNHFAAMMIFCLPFTDYMIARAKKPWVKVMLVTLMGAQVLAIILTFSRTGAVMLVLVSALILANRLRHFSGKRLGFLLAGAGLVAALLMIAVPDTYWERQKSIVSSADYSKQHRLSYLEVGWKALLGRPIVGYGPDTFSRIYAASPQALHFKRASDTVEDLARDAHNTYMEVAAGTGVLGIIAFLGIVITAFLNFTRAIRNAARRDSPFLADAIRACRTAFISIALYFVFLSSVYHKFFWAALGLSQLSFMFSVAPEGAKQERNEASH